MRKIRCLMFVITAGLACWCVAGGGAVDGAKIDQGKTIEQIKEKGEFSADTAKDKVKPQSPAKLYAVECVAGRTYTIELRSEEFDAYLRLEDSTGKIVAENDDDGGGAKGTDARIVYKAPKSGTYTIVATAYGTANKGKYTLTVVHDGAGAPPDIKYLIDVKAKLTKDDPKDKDRGGVCYMKSYKIDMKAQTTYVIQLDSKDFDAFIRLVDAGGKEVASDDDGALDGLNAKLVYQCKQTGAYTIVATTFAHPDTGEFHLRVHAK
ncbi:MAG TPA: PPC domain-containing protein [Gemmataceae bacterium]|nr:PPC domain-containing protein [Gemmataceae bacterium]